MKFTEKLPRLTIPTMPRLPRPAGDTPGKTRHRLNATGALEHLLATPEGVWAWYVLEGVDWPMQSAEHRQQIMQAQTFVRPAPAGMSLEASGWCFRHGVSAPRQRG